MELRAGLPRSRCSKWVPDAPGRPYCALRGSSCRGCARCRAAARAGLLLPCSMLPRSSGGRFLVAVTLISTNRGLCKA